MYLIFGKGKSGKAASKLLELRNLPHLLVDDKTPNWQSYLKSTSTVVVSPGIPPFHPLFGLSRNKELIGETELAYRFWKGSVVAITGTDGKSTTTRLVYLILKSYLSGVYEGGNIGRPFSEIVSQTSSGIAVLEVSSFQGYTLKTFRPSVGVFLNFAPDHLDWHRDLEDYLRGKYKIFLQQREGDLLFLNGWQEEVKKTPSRAKKLLFGKGGEIEIRSDGWVYFEGEKLFEWKKLKIKGIHNAWNSAVASAVGRIFGVPPKVIREVLYEFRGLPYRLQYLGDFKGLKVYNDSKSTTPNALKMALQSFDKKVVLIFGGKDKGADFTPLRELFKKRVKVAIAYGENGDKLVETFKDCVPTERVKTLEEALRLAKGKVAKGDILLFSPASASFDQFKSYEERGKIFEKLVKEIF
ncbi:MAG TPA: UDP-N-acetylmuramoyl-L-alanine--D-glutamate ligase [Aquifex aeolicus]|uniref:UDP-N-acetylmuramoylalanine--D-glutamate ligase n=1 Tax=Aquifex aeolicus TaxID=63363 RepID=A0A9D0YPN5_AQUAO|nr:UDP-N-acetylmuramoyl-L-alanine--D-glutamate ligase [Aquificales bacterium]HIP98691.1 UDP-N-acetylmuramoyl-L-alanine--D-glutamate ligase [Aquifex aeolicus]HIQ25879.1 UDP-N-acetylmuramoyl-L-alanine--D-glutamate ligase [Aquifex aeolicus]